jgi:MerR family transcriptional regulator, light-induced transcriptional regulator
MPKQILSNKPIYNLSLVLQETGIKADTLRAWERRYNLPQPHRSQGGHRLFSEFDIETIKWLIARQNEGMRISRAVHLWREIESDGQDPITSMSGQISPPPSITEQVSISLISERARWIQACLSFNEPAAEQVLNQSFAQFSMETVCIQILQSGLAEIGSLWYQGSASVQQEHFAAELAVRRLYSLISAAPQPNRSGTILAACPHGENHTFSTLLITLLLRYHGWNVINLGANVPAERLKDTVEKMTPNLVIMSSMRLVTAAALFETALLLKELGIPMAFGGRVFTTTPGCIQRIPGYYWTLEKLL